MSKKCNFGKKFQCQWVKHNDSHSADSTKNHQNVKKMQFWQKVPGVNGLSTMTATKFSSSYALRKLFATRNRYCLRTNILAYFRAKWRLLCLLSFKSFSQRAQLFKIGEYPFPSFSWGIFTHVTRLDQSCTSENI